MTAGGGAESTPPALGNAPISPSTADSTPGRDLDVRAPRYFDELFDLSTDLGRDMAAVNWTATPLGPPESWPGSLRNIVRVMLGSRFAMWMAWGPQLTFFCNDAYRRNTLGAKYPWALGRRADEVWEEIWPDIGPRIESVITTGVATWDESLLLFLERSGYPEETYHTFSYSPISDDDGAISGMLCVVSEETDRVVSQRRMRIVRDLSSALAAAGTQTEVFSAAARQLGRGKHSLPFAVGYLFDDECETAERVLAAGISLPHALAPATISVSDAAAPWPAASAAMGHVELVDDLPGRFADIPTGAWREPPLRATVVPFIHAGNARPFGFLVVGLNRYRELDADYRGFIHVVAGQLAAAITRARAFEEERQRAEDLAELDRAKTLFFTNVSHELRTPLTLLLGPAADALADAAEPLGEHQRGRLEVIARNGERLLKLVNTLLDFSRIQSGQAEGTFQPVDLARWTTELAAMFEPSMRRAGLEFVIDCPPLPETVYVDREMWAKIVLNLLSNALKATFAGRVEVHLRPATDGIELAVSDTGVGIPSAEQSRLFERFHRITGARLRTHEGSGIGLALVAELTALHGGTVGVDSVAGEGSTFTVRIPAGRAHLPADRVVDRSEELPDPEAFSVGYLAEVDRWLATPRTAGGDVTQKAAANDARPRVLVVDDNADMREYVSGLLSRDYSVTVAADGRQALGLAHREPPDLVLTDVMMPELDGFGLLEALREDPDTMHVPVVMLSARAGDEAAVVGLEAGADDYLVKPFSARELLARVRANLELDRVRRVSVELARSRTLLDQAEQLAHVGSWELNLGDGSVRVSAEVARLLGRTVDEVQAGGLAGVLSFVLPSERENVNAALERTAAGDEPMDVEFRISRPDGTTRLLRANAVLHRPDRDAAPKIRGSVQDITDQRAAEQAITASHAAREAAAREHAIAEELQRSLLPARIPRNDHYAVAAYYVSGVEGTQAGGDWYDVIDLPDDRTAMVVGDVMGRGVRAAAVMGQLRAMIRGYARLDLPVETLLKQLDGEVAAIGNATIVTCVYAVLDSRAGTLTYGTAGHVPPLLTVPGSPTTLLTAGDPPLGSNSYQGAIETVDWIPGSRLTLYTDGLVEHRGCDIDESIEQLARLLDDTSLAVEEVPNHLVASLLPERPTDDVAVLTVAARSPESREFVMSIPPVGTSVAEARRAAAAALGQWGVDEGAGSDVILLVSELVTNTLRHAQPPIELRMRLDKGERDRIVLDVSDGAALPPTLRKMDPAATTGRGLQLVSALARTWGARPTGTGKSVWCVVDLPSS